MPWRREARFDPGVPWPRGLLGSPVADPWATELLRSPLEICYRGARCLTDKVTLAQTDSNFWVIVAQRRKASIYRTTWRQLSGREQLG
jgi:hypothetical protein